LVKTTKGVKWQHCSRQGSVYFFFFSLSCRQESFQGLRSGSILHQHWWCKCQWCNPYRGPKTLRWGCLHGLCWSDLGSWVVFTSAVQLELVWGLSRTAEGKSAC
jgi:hypothetical protein